ncbi:MAG: diguanylate cyclase [Granulosicoccus sp.]
MDVSLTAVSPAHASEFELTKRFSVACLIGVVLVTVSLIFVYRGLTERHLIEHETRANTELAQLFVNGVWSDHRDFVLRSEGTSREKLMADSGVERLMTDVRRQMRGLQVQKIKVYALDGNTVFSTDTSQIGDDKSENSGFLSALAGDAVGAVTYRERFDAMEGILTDRDLVYSYVPLRNPDTQSIEGVLEVYSDVSLLLARQRAAQWQVAGLVLGLLALLYIFLFTVVRRADRHLTQLESERLARETQIQHQALHDPLTGLANRASFPEYLKAAIRRKKGVGRGSALMYVDLDYFKKVNDMLGHAAGDQLLVELSNRMRACLRAEDRLFRIGGDEFTVVMGEADRIIIDSVAQRLLETVKQPMVLCGKTIIPGATIGVALIPDSMTTADALIKKADEAMYSAKAAGRGRCAYHGPNIGPAKAA